MSRREAGRHDNAWIRYEARDRRAYLRGHWIDLVALVPTVRGLRALRLLHRARLGRVLVLGAALVALVVLGGETIRGFAVALLIGTISGTYSSLFTAAPLLAVWKGRRVK